MDKLCSFIEVGVTHLILHVPAPYPAGIVQRLAKEVAEPLSIEYAKANAQSHIEDAEESS